MTDVEVGGPLGLQDPAFLHPPLPDADTAPLSSPLNVDPSNHFDDQSSQDSSLSRHSQQTALKQSTSDVSGLAVAALPAVDLTPPSSNASVAHDDEHSLSSKATKAASGQPISELAKEATSPRHKSNSPHSASSREGVAGTKRTATGEVKPGQNTEHFRSVTSDRLELGHVRASSMLSSGSSSNVTEISSQLRTKLKYAMLKVQNGWQARSLDELESIASASPRSTVSGFQHLQDRAAFASPQSRVNPRLQRKWSDSSSSESNRSDAQGHVPNPPGPSAPMDSRNPYSSRSLAPPADIKPGARRRPTPNDGLALSGMTASPMFHGRSPAVRPSPSQRTPSQNAAMEADAVETLLFMASPNNSGYHPPSQASQESSLRSTLIAQTSPLRTQFSQTSVTSPKKVAFSEHDAPGHLRTREAQIDHMLDTLPDDSDEELDRISVSTKGFASARSS